MSRKLKTAFFVFFAGLVLTAGTVYAVLLLKHQNAPRQNGAWTAEHNKFAREFHEFGHIAGREDFPSFALYDLQDRQYDSMAVVKGRVTLVNLWAVWCAPCITELPSLMALEKKMKDKGHDFHVVYISLDDPEDGAALKASLEKFDLGTVPSHYTKGTGAWSVLNVSALPTSILLSPDGEIQYRMAGDTDWSEAVAFQFMDRFSASYGAGG